MFGHFPELILILVIALIVFGPEKLPQVAADAGRMMREVRDALNTAMNPEDTELSDDFSTYYYESLERSGEDFPAEEGAGYEEMNLGAGEEPGLDDGSQSVRSEGGEEHSALREEGLHREQDLFPAEPRDH
jgi:TatA/E family protein of Tat protein translocase